MSSKKPSKITLKKLCIAFYRVSFTNKIHRLPRSYFWILQSFSFWIIGGLAGLCIRLGEQMVFMYVLGGLLACLSIISIFEGYIVRAHDSDRTITFLLWGFIPGVGMILLPFLAIALVAIGFYPSNKGNNRFGKEFNFDRIESAPPKTETDK